MFRKITKRLISVCLILLMLAGMGAVGEIGTLSASAANDTPFKVRIADVTRRFKDAKSFLDLVNSYRKQSGLSELVMDEEYFEAAMVRAAELSVYASSKSPNGQDGLYKAIGTNDGGQIHAYDFRSMSALFNDCKNDSGSSQIILSSRYQSVGIGVVEVNGYKFLDLIASPKKPVAVDSATLSQDSITMEQEIETLPTVISDMSPAYSDGSGVYCGSSLQAYVKVKNLNYPDVFVYLKPYNATVSLSDTTVFSYKYDRVYALTPGTCVMTITFPGTSALSVSCSLKAVGKSFGTCKFDSIPDQVYTGSAIRPSVTIVDSNGNTLVKGQDYELTYVNNVNVGLATIKVTGKGTYTGQSKELYFNIISGGSGEYFGINILLSQTTVNYGGSTVISVVASGGTAPFKYTYQYALYGTSDWVTLRSSTTSDSYTFTPPAAKNYYVRVNAVDSKGNSASQSSMVRVTDEMSVTVTANPTTAAVGGTVKVKAVGVGGKAPLEYAFYLLKPDNSSWVLVSDYSDKTEWSFRPETDGSYRVCIRCKNASGDIVKDYVNIKAVVSTLSNASTISKTEVDVGQSISIKGLGKSNSTANFTYSYFYKLNSEESYHAISRGTAQTPVSWTPTKEGAYTVLVKVFDDSQREVRKTFAVRVNPALKNNTTLSATSVNPGSKVTIKGSASGGSGSFQYSMYYRKSSQTSYTSIQSLSTAASAVFQPSEAGTYYIKTKVKDAVDCWAEKEIKLTVLQSLTNNTTISATTVTKDTNVKLTCAASGGTSPYQYRVYIKKPGADNYTMVSDYSTTKTRSVTLSVAGTYGICVKVMDAKNTVVRKDFNVKVNTSPVNHSTISSTTVVKGSSVTLNCSVTGGTALVQYRVYVMEPGASSYTMSSDYSPNQSRSVTLNKIGTYQIKVKARDACNVFASKDFKVTSTTDLKNNTTISSTTSVKGESISLTCGASGGASPYQYRVYVKKPGADSYTMSSDYSTTKARSITFSAEGTWQIKVKVKDANEDVVSKDFTVNVNHELRNTTSISSTSVSKGNNITLTCTATGGTSPYQFRVYVKKPGASNYEMVSDYSYSQSRSVPMTMQGTYGICVKVKDAKETIARKDFTVTVK